MIENFSTYLKHKLQEKLPGKTAHIEVAPYRKVDFDKKELQQAKKSGVLILFYVKDQEIYTALMQRTIYEGKHSGQISFPGGKVEKSDKSIYHTALREANEEIGIATKDIEIIGQLSEVFIPVSNFHVIPVVGIIRNIPQFKIEKREVEEIIEFKLTHLITQELKQNKVKLANNTILQVPSFEHNQKIIWGATALMLNELKHILVEWETT
jgi:8-oxo-dGTP pyrophosphatase MutT (NUDIX family)